MQSLSFKRIGELFLIALPLLPMLSGATVPLFRDRGEFDIAAQVERERDPVNLLLLLNRWAKLYPNSAFEPERDDSLIKSYRSMNMGWLMLDTARHMAEEDPHGLGNYWAALLVVSLRDASPSGLAAGRAAAEAVLENSAVSFAVSNRPVSVPREAWFNERDRQQALAHRTLGWIDLQEHRFSDAEQEFGMALRFNPRDAEATFWMAQALIGEHTYAQRASAIRYLSESLAVTGKGALSAEARALVKLVSEAERADLTPPSFELPMNGPQDIPEPPQASVLYSTANAAFAPGGLKPISRGALLIHPVLDIGSPADSAR